MYTSWGRKVHAKLDINLFKYINASIQIQDINVHLLCTIRLPWYRSGKESVCQCRRLRFDP